MVARRSLTARGHGKTLGMLDPTEAKRAVWERRHLLASSHSSIIPLLLLLLLLQYYHTLIFLSLSLSGRSSSPPSPPQHQLDPFCLSDQFSSSPPQRLTALIFLELPSSFFRLPVSLSLCLSPLPPSITPPLRNRPSLNRFPIFKRRQGRDRRKESSHHVCQTRGGCAAAAC